MINLIRSVIDYIQSEEFRSLLAVLRVIFIFLSVVFLVLIIWLRWKAGYFRDMAMMWKWRLEKPPQKEKMPEEE